MSERRFSGCHCDVEDHARNFRRDRLTADNAPRVDSGGGMMRRILPPWLRFVLIGSALWIAVALVRGITFALTQAAHGG